MKRNQGRDLRPLPTVDYRESSTLDDVLEVTSEEEAASTEDLEEAQVDIAASTPFRLAPPRLLIEGVTFDTSEDAPQESESTDDLPFESLAEDYHSAVNFLGQFSHNSEEQSQGSVGSESRTVVEGGTSPDSVDRSRRNTLHVPSTRESVDTPRGPASNDPVEQLSHIACTFIHR